MAVNLSAIKDLLLPGLRGIEGKYEMIPSQYDRIFTKHDSKLALERTAEMRFLGLAQLKTEGGQTSFDNGAGERFVYNQSILKLPLVTPSPARRWTTTSTRPSSIRRTSA